MHEQVTERMLHAYFENKATQSEKQLIKRWLEQEGNEETFYYYLSAWESRHLQYQPDMSRATAKYRSVLAGEHTAKMRDMSQKQSAMSSGTMRWMAVAASLLLLMVAGYWLSNDFFRYTTYTTTYGMTRNILLDDGSEVTLNANSTLKVPKDLASAGMREVWLEGEGFFAIAKRPGHVRFAVHAPNMDIEVLGTRFNVNSRRGNTEVVLDEGSVKLTRPAGSTTAVYMKPGDYVMVVPSDTILRRKVVKPSRYTAWQTNKLVFEDTPIKVVAQRIEDYYGVKIEIRSPEVARREVTGTLPNNDLGIVLKSLSTSHKLDIVREKDLIIFR